jgi:DNA-binding protein HU-beta
LAAGGEVALAGFGKFSVSHRAARQGRNPSTGQTISIPASKAAKFSAASALKKRLNP